MENVIIESTVNSAYDIPQGLSGVYSLINKERKVIYVGHSQDIKTRSVKHQYGSN